MQHQHQEKLLVVMLDELINHSLPRILAVQQHLQRGELLSDAEIYFFSDVLNKVNQCYGAYLHDTQCKVIFSTIAHLLFKVIKKALKNEKKQAAKAGLKQQDLTPAAA